MDTNTNDWRKASASVANGQCVEVREWVTPLTTSSYSSNNADCVEVGVARIVERDG